MSHAPPAAAAPAFAAAALLQKSHGGGGGLAHTIPKKRTTTTTPEYEFSQVYALEIQPIPPPPPETTTSKPKPKPKPTTTTTTKPKPKPKPKPTTSSVTGIPIPLSTTTTPPTTSKAEATASESIIPSPGADRDSQPISTGFSNNNTGLIVGVVLGVLAIVAMVTGLLFWKRRNRRRADEVRKVDLYQQQRMMSDQNAFTGGGRDRDHDRGGLSFHGSMSSSSHGKQVVRDIQDPQPGGGGRRGYGRQIQQPDWWVRKTPLEYHQQVPPLEVLERMAERKQEHDTKGAHHADSVMAARRNSVDLTEQRRHISQESIAIHSTQQKTPSKNRLSPIRPISPIGSVFKNITGSSLTPRPTRAYNSPPQQSGYTGHGNAANPTPNQYYHPPPPLPPVPISSEQTGSLPSPGFYDFIPLDNETEQTMPVVHKTAGVIPPPIPRATRPSLNLARGLILGLDQGPSTINQRLSTNVTKVAPMTTTPPQLDMQWSDSPSKAHSKGIQLSPISSYNSDMSSLPSVGAGVGPRMGGRRPRTKSKSSNMDTSI